MAEGRLRMGLLSCAWSEIHILKWLRFKGFTSGLHDELFNVGEETKSRSDLANGMVR